MTRPTKEQIEAMRTFILDGLQHVWDGCDWDGADIQDRAKDLGLIVEVPGGYNPEVHGESEFDADPGDTWYTAAKFIMGAKP